MAQRFHHFPVSPPYPTHFLRIRPLLLHTLSWKSIAMRRLFQACLDTFKLDTWPQREANTWIFDWLGSQFILLIRSSLRLYFETHYIRYEITPKTRRICFFLSSSPILFQLYHVLCFCPVLVDYYFAVISLVSREFIYDRSFLLELQRKWHIMRYFTSHSRSSGHCQQCIRQTSPPGSKKR